MLVVALVGVAVNLVATRRAAGADRRSLNVEGAFQHLLTDLVAFVATAIAAVVILLTGFDEADAIAALLVAAIMLRAAWSLLRASARVFLEAAPDDLDVEAVGHAMAAHAGVVEVHDLHVWEVTRRLHRALGARARRRRRTTATRSARALERMLHEQLRDRAHDAAGRSRARPAADDREPLSAVFGSVRVPRSVPGVTKLLQGGRTDYGLIPVAGGARDDGSAVAAICALDARPRTSTGSR